MNVYAAPTPAREKRVRLFLGGLPEYTAIALVGSADKVLIHHDGPHAFDQVVKDMSSLHVAREAVIAIIAHDSHLHGHFKQANFVDMALYSVFGTELACTPIGARYAADNATMTQPNRYRGNHFVPDQPEGMVMLMADNTLCYPHPSMQLSEFLRNRA